MDGILNINKPPGKTSFGVVSLVKRLSGERRVGHAGTLDPSATGVLPVCLGQATRIVEYLVDATKSYRAEIELGVATDTYDACGRITRRGDASGISREQLESALAGFRGLIQQTPPMYSAVRHQGQKLYELARAGIEVERQSRPARIHRLELLDWRPPLATIEVECGKGTYIRSLAHDLGERLGCGASLKGLVRLRCSIFDIGNAVSEAQLEAAFRSGYWRRFIYPIDSVLCHWPAVVVSDAVEDMVRQGRPLSAEDAPCPESAGDITSSPSGERCRAYTADGQFLAVLRLEGGQWRPEKVFLPPPQPDSGGG